MKNWKSLTAGLLAVSLMTAGLTVSLSVSAAAANAAQPAAGAAYKDGSVYPAEKSETVRKAAREKAMSDYYITSGPTLDKVVARLLTINPEETGLPEQIDFNFRLDKSLTGNYFHHLKAFHPKTAELAGEYLLAKDDSCVFRRFPGENRTELLDGTTEKLMETVEIYAIYKKIPMDGAGKVSVRVPGNIPYQLSLTSLNETVASIRTDENGQPQVHGLVKGNADILAQVTIGKFSKSQNIRFTVMDEKEIRREENRRTGTGLPIDIGIGWGWGRRWGWGHGHHRSGPLGGIGIRI